MDLARPDERVPLAAAMLAARRRGLRLGRDFAFVELDVGEALGDDCAEYLGLLVRRAVQPGLVSEFEADALALDPAHGAFDRPVLAEVKMDAVPQQRFEVARDHRPAARQIDQLDLAVFALVGHPDLLVGQAVAVAVAGVGAAGFLPRHGNAVECVGLGPLGLLGLHHGILLGLPAENPCPNIHFVTPRSAVAAILSRNRVTEWFRTNNTCRTRPGSASSPSASPLPT